MFNNVNLNLLRTLHVLLDENHVSNAARRLNISQSAVSRQLSQLRELFGDPLLIREGNILIPTPKALDIKLKLNALFEEFDLLLKEQHFESSEWNGEFVFSCSDYVAQYIFPSMISQILEHAPKATFRYVMWESKFIDQLANSEIHVASTMLPEKPEGVSSIKLGEDKPVIVMCSQHDLAGKDNLELTDILGYPHILINGGGDKHSAFEAALMTQGEKRKIGLKVPFYSAAFSVLEKSQYLLVVPEHIAKHMQSLSAIVYKPIPLPMDSHKYWVIWHSKYDRDPTHRWLREQTINALKSNMYSIGYDYKS